MDKSFLILNYAKLIPSIKAIDFFFLILRNITLFCFIFSSYCLMNSAIVTATMRFPPKYMHTTYISRKKKSDIKVSLALSTNIIISTHLSPEII